MNTIMIHTYIERLSNLLRNEIRQAGSDFGLQPIQLEALHYLSICNRYSDTPMGVTEYLGQTKGTVSQTLKVLERKGYLSKKVDNDDKRVIHLKVTAAGRKLLANIIPTPNFVEGCGSLGDDIQQQLGENLKVLLRSIQQARGSKTFGVCHTCKYNRNDGGGNFYCGLVNAPLTDKEVKLICREHEFTA